MATKIGKVFGGGGLSGYADKERKAKGGKKLFQTWEEIEKNAKRKKSF
jgi:hypothetical protein